MFQINLEWKEFNIDLDVVNSHFKEAYPTYLGNQAHKHIELWFKEEPDQATKDHVKAYWDGLTATSTEATSHKSQSDRKKEIDDARVSAKKKLAALGLTDTEIKALGIGV